MEAKVKIRKKMGKRLPWFTNVTSFLGMDTNRRAKEECTPQEAGLHGPANGLFYSAPWLFTELDALSPVSVFLRAVRG